MGLEDSPRNLLLKCTFHVYSKMYHAWNPVGKKHHVKLSKKNQHWNIHQKSHGRNGSSFFVFTQNVSSSLAHCIHSFSLFKLTSDLSIADSLTYRKSHKKTTRWNHHFFFTGFAMPKPSMGLVYLPAWMLDFYGCYAGKYTIHYMDAMGWFLPPCINESFFSTGGGLPIICWEKKPNQTVGDMNLAVTSIKNTIPETNSSP